MKEKRTRSDRRNFLKATAAALVAASIPVATAGQADETVADDQSKAVYLYGAGWNRDLPGVFGRAYFKFNMSAKIGGTGFGTISDEVHSELNSQFRIDSATKSGKNFVFRGPIISSRTPEMVGMQVTIAAESTEEGTGKASFTVESQESNLVVIAIIAVLIGLLLPAVQKVR